MCAVSVHFDSFPHAMPQQTQTQTHTPHYQHTPPPPLQVRTFVSGVNPSAVAGVQVLDDTKLATYATLATAGADSLCMYFMCEVVWEAGSGWVLLTH